MKQDDDVRVPNLTQPLLDALDHLYPELCADPAETDREIWIRTGERKVVRFLLEQFNRQLTG